MEPHSHSLEEWAQNIVGRDWEIYWSCENDQEENQQQQNQQEEQQQQQQVNDESLAAQRGGDFMNGEPIPGKQAVTEEKEANEDDDDEEEDEDIEDWYDGHVESIDSVKEDGSYSFRVHFVGDETIYTMVLEPKRVRPSARAWIKRSKTLLSYHAQQQQQSPCKGQKSFNADWETLLPPDTSTLADLQDLARLHAENQALNNDYEVDAQAILHDNAGDHAHNLPQLEEVNQIKRLASLLGAQVSLRSKLAPIVELPDHPSGPSESYIEHLLQCLKRLDEACRWYLQCWKLHRIIFNKENQSSISTTTEKLHENFAISAGLQEGRRAITHLLRIDTSLAGSKRRRPAETLTRGGTRKTKRRRRNKSLVEFIKESERGFKVPSPDEDEFLSSDAVANYVEQVRCNDNRWYTSHFAKMLQSLSLNIVAPLLDWRHRVETIIGDRPEPDVDNIHSDGETSDEDSDDEGGQIAEDNPTEQNGSTPTKGKRFYTFDEIKSFEEAANSDIFLRNFNLSSWQARLRLKLSGIEAFEKRCWWAVSQVFSKPSGEVVTKQNDNIFSELCQVKAIALSSTSPVKNVNPLGHSSSLLCRKVLEDALTIRSWFLDLLFVESRRERLVFIDKMATRASELPRLPSCQYTTALDALFDEAVARLRKISQGYFDHLTRFNKYRSILLSHFTVSNDEGTDFMTSDGVSRALRELGDIQVLSIAEEMLSVRLDVLRWKADAQNLLSKPEIPFEELVASKTVIDSILDGRSETRTKMLLSIEVNEKVNAEVRSFAEADVTALCGSLVALLNSKYALTCTWKERAGPILSAIKQHSGQCNIAQKPPPMVDVKRIQGALAEYVDLGIFLPKDRSFLEKVHATANRWSQDLTTNLMDRTKPLSDLLSCLQSSKLDRPRGVIVDPARHVVDNLLDLLLWHQQTIEALKEMSSKQKDVSEERMYSSAIKSLYLLVAEGSEVLEFLGTKNDNIQFSVNHVVALDLMLKELDLRRPMRVISYTKLESNDLGKTLLDRVLDEDHQQGSPLLFLLLVLWQASVASFIDKYENRKGTKNATTLEAAKGLMSQRPVAPTMVDETSEPENWGIRPSAQEKQLEVLINDGEKVEGEALRLLGVSKELLRGPYRHMDAVHNHLCLVKEILGLFKVPLATNGSGLALSKNLEQQLDHHVKVLSWLVRTFPYPFLHKVHCDLDPENRIQWDVLVHLNRKPERLESMGDCAGIALRLAEVFEAASAWQAEITKVTMLSNRGAKRRGETVAEAEGNVQQTVELEKVYRLAKDPVLKKVAMPRESAVAEILESAKTFEVHLHRFLGEDYDGDNPDRAPYPDTESLIGRSGEFLLYRFTGSPLYDSLLSSIEQITTIAQDVLADTPGKAAFDWIRKAVSWIESLRAAVTLKTYAIGSVVQKLVINESDARSILESGKGFFLDIPEDLRKTLSTHRIHVSTNREKIKVVFKKGGAHHSVGGTAIRWCPVLFHSLREDISRLDTWKKQVQNVHSKLESFSAERDNLSEDENDLSKLHAFLEEVSILVEEGIESLVVSPPKESFEQLHELLTQLRASLSQMTDPSWYERITQKRYKDKHLLLSDRFELLDSLLFRSALEFERQDQSDSIRTVNPPEGTFRDTCRAYLEKALQKTMQMIGLPLPSQDSPESTLCSTKAWEIEFEMYARFQANLAPDVISSEYKEMARTIRWVFEDCVNPELCIQILADDIEVSELVTMSEEQLVGKSLMANIHSEAMEEENITTQTSDESEMPLSHSLPNAAQTEISQDEKNPKVPDPEETDSVEEVEANKPDKLIEESEKARAETPSSEPRKIEMPVQEPTGAKRPEGAPPTASSTPRPDAPPSLAASLVNPGVMRSHGSTKVAQTKSTKRAKYLINSSGQDTFLLAVSKPLIKFKARFYVENSRQALLYSCLPQELTEKGRLRIEEFSKFLSGKLKGGKWVAIPLRMSLPSDEDAKKHKTFYKEYESTKRIAMFAISDYAKMFLISPKFHRVAAKVLGSSFSVETSTYAIILTKESCL